MPPNGVAEASATGQAAEQSEQSQRNGRHGDLALGGATTTLCLATEWSNQ